MVGGPSDTDKYLASVAGLVDLLQEGQNLAPSDNDHKIVEVYISHLTEVQKTLTVVDENPQLASTIFEDPSLLKLDAFVELASSIETPKASEAWKPFIQRVHTALEALPGNPAWNPTDLPRPPK